MIKADELIIELDDSNRLWAIPAQDSLIQWWIGFNETGVIYKCEFKMSEFTHLGAPDKFSITARSGDLDEKLADNKKKADTDRLCRLVETIAQKYHYQYLIGKNIKN